MYKLAILRWFGALLIRVLMIDAELTVGFYNTTCPHVDSIVRSTIIALANRSNVVAPSTLRLLVHDCFVQGCDASILLSSTPNNTAERDAPINNLPQTAFDAIQEAKKAVEAQCPGVVSCADILAMAARDAVLLTGGPSWDVPTGRRDGLVSKASLVAGRLPGSDFNVTQLTDNFAQVNLTLADMVVLSGGHTIGFSHCDQFRRRLYNFNGFNTTDPSMDVSYIASLQKVCPQNETGAGGFHAFDVSTPFVFDNAYFKNLQMGEGLLFADQALFVDNRTTGFVNQLASSNEVFFKAFAEAMIKMSSIDVKTGIEGEIRMDCSKCNLANDSTIFTRQT